MVSVEGKMDKTLKKDMLKNSCYLLYFVANRNTDVDGDY